jgi:hypothetical protein
MFKIGQIIVCKNPYNLKEKGLTMGKRYNVIHNGRLIWIADDRGWLHSYSRNRFMTLEEDRRTKLEILCSRLVKE